MNLKKIFFCDACKENFISKTKLRNHKNNTVCKNSHKCKFQQCSSVFQHFDLKMVFQYRCSFCTPYKSKDRKEMQVHLSRCNRTNRKKRCIQEISHSEKEKNIMTSVY